MHHFREKLKELLRENYPTYWKRAKVSLCAPLKDVKRKRRLRYQTFIGSTARSKSQPSVTSVHALMVPFETWILQINSCHSN